MECGCSGECRGSEGGAEWLCGCEGVFEEDGGPDEAAEELDGHCGGELIKVVLGVEKLREQRRWMLGDGLCGAEVRLPPQLISYL